MVITREILIQEHAFSLSKSINYYVLRIRGRFVNEWDAGLRDKVSEMANEVQEINGRYDYIFANESRMKIALNNILHWDSNQTPKQKREPKEKA